MQAARGAKNTNRAGGAVDASQKAKRERERGRVGVRESGSLNLILQPTGKSSGHSYTQMGSEALEGLRVSLKPAASRKINKRSFPIPLEILHNALGKGWEL